MVGNHRTSTETPGDDPEFIAAEAAFEDALRAAIHERGLSLERIHEHLRAAGAEVSPATLSYWQSGKTRPERARSLVALGHLERILDIPPGTLSKRLGPPRPRGRWLHHNSGELAASALWEDAESAAAAQQQINTQWDGWLTRLSQQDRFEVGADGAERGAWSRLVLRAEDDGPDRWTCVYRAPEHAAPPTLTPTEPCRLGRRAVLPGNEHIAAEILFDRPLTKGETVVCDYYLACQPPFAVATEYERKFRFPVREYLVEVRFQSPALPTNIRQYEAMTVTSEEKSRPLSLDGAHGVHAIGLGVGPGRFGIRWDW